MKVFILRGVAGSGKDTYIERVLRLLYPALRVFSSDNFFVNPITGVYEFAGAKLPEAHGWNLREFTRAVYLRFEEYLKSHVHSDDVLVVNNTNLRVFEFAPYAGLALAHGCELEIITLATDWQVAAARNIHGVPEKSVMNMALALDKGTEEIPPWWKHTVVNPNQQEVK